MTRHRLTRLRAALAWALALATIAIRPAAAQSEVITHAYDVRAICARHYDQPGPRLDFDGPDDARSSAFGEDDDRAITPEALYTLIADNVEPGSWQGERRLSIRDDVLVVSAPPEVHARIAAILASIRAKQASLLTLEWRVYAAPAAAAEVVLAGGSVLDPQRVELLSHAPWTCVRATRLIAHSGQRLHVARTQHRAYLADYDVAVADFAHGWAPTMRTMLTGDVVDATATLADGGHGVLIGVRHDTTAAVLPMAEFELGLRTRAGKPLPPLELPRTQTRTLRNALWVPLGGQAIAGAARQGEEVLVVIVRHLHRPVALPAPPLGDGKRTTRLYDCRYVVYQPLDFRPPPLGRAPTAPPGRGDVGTAIFDSGDEGVRLTPDALIEAIKSKIDPESWENERSSLGVVGGQLFATQTPEVLAQLEVYLAQLERLRSLSLFVRAQMLVATDEATERELMDLVGDQIPPAGVSALRQRIASGSGVRVSADSATAALPGQKVYVATYATEAYVQDHSLSIAAGTLGFDPEISWLRHGAVLSVRPTLIQADQQVLLELILAKTNLVGMPDRETGDGQRLMAPTLEGGQRRLQLVIKEGGTALVDLGRGQFARIEIYVSRPARDGDK